MFFQPCKYLSLVFFQTGVSILQVLQTSSWSHFTAQGEPHHCSCWSWRDLLIKDYFDVHKGLLLCGDLAAKVSNFCSFSWSSLLQAVCENAMLWCKPGSCLSHLRSSPRTQQYCSSCCTAAISLPPENLN